MKRIGFIGIGVMGQSMARNLMKNGYELTVFTRTKEKAQPLLDEGAHWAESAGACAREQDVVITMVGYPNDVRDVYFDDEGIIAQAKPGSYLIDMTTTVPELSVEIFSEARKRGIFTLDAPVSGGEPGARNGTLAIMVGGDELAFQACMPIFELLGGNVRYAGPAGCGQHTKMANQIAIAGALAGVCEAITYARENGLDPQNMVDSISTGSAKSWQLEYNGAKILAGDFAPTFLLKHYIKDLSIAEEAAAQIDLSLPVLETVLDMYHTLAEEGMGGLGSQALIKYYE